MQRLPSASIIILNRNGVLHLQECLNTLHAQSSQPEQIILVDNGSTDDSLTLVRRQFPNVIILESEIDLGKGHGYNLALRNLETTIAVLLQPEISGTSAWLKNILRPFENDPAVGIVLSGQINTEGHQVAGQAIYHPLALPEHINNSPAAGRHPPSPIAGHPMLDTVMAIRREVLELAGLFDGGFYKHYEDADLCIRAQRHGYHVVYEPQAAVLRDSFTYDLRPFNTGRWRFLLKHFTPGDILSQTLPEEAAWLEKITDDERIALGLAYQDTLNDLPAIMSTRIAHGAPEISESDLAQITGNLQDLRQAAMLWPVNRARWQELAQAGQVKAQPFSSKTTLFGPIFARLRDVWASVATKEFAGELTDQQRQFNHSFVMELQSLEGRLRAYESVWLQQEEEQRELAWEIKALQKELDEAYRLLASIESRMARMGSS